jgi:hypothetical protein
MRGAAQCLEKACKLAPETVNREESVMWNLIAIALILVVTISVYFIAMWVTKMTNDRGDEILHGVVKGVPASTKDRWLMLFTQWLPYAVFLTAFLLIAAVGNVQIARTVEDPRVQLLGYMCGGFLAMGGLFWLLLGCGFVFLNMVSTLRQTTRP